MQLAAQGSSVLVIDADEQGELSRRLDLRARPGLSELLAPEDAHGETIHPTSTPRLHILPLGRGTAAPLAIGPALSRMLADLAEEYAWILVAAGHADGPLTQALARACQGTYVAATLTELGLPQARESLTRLRNAGGRVLGSMVVE
jgi:Mrp family chromosome partitioning ATPase